MSALSDFFYQQAQKALDAVDPIPPAPIPPPCVTGEAQDNKTELAGSPSIDWALDTRQSRELSDAEVIDKMNWQLRAINAAQRLQSEFERLAPTVYPEVK